EALDVLFDEHVDAHGGIVHEHDVVDRADVDARKPDDVAHLQPAHIAEIRTDLEDRVEEVLLLADQKDGQEEEHDAHEDEDPESYFERIALRIHDVLFFAFLE